MYNLFKSDICIGIINIYVYVYVIWYVPIGYYLYLQTSIILRAVVPLLVVCGPH